jgi:hypothetical protein
MAPGNIPVTLRGLNLKSPAFPLPLPDLLTAETHFPQFPKFLGEQRGYKIFAVTSSIMFPTRSPEHLKNLKNYQKINGKNLGNHPRKKAIK